jgi:formylglycine-generating enzyme
MKSTMKFSILFFFVFTQITLLNAQNEPLKLNIKDIDKSMAMVHDSLYASKYELSNVLYRTFVQDLKNNHQTELLKIAILDTNVWRAKQEYNEPLVRYYHRHPNYNDYPVVGVSYEAASQYCKWLTDKYNSDPKRQYKRVLFRLPTEKEWEIAAYGGKQYVAYPWGNRLRNSKGWFLCNFRWVGDENIIYDSLNHKFIVDLDNSPNGSYEGTASDLNDASSITESVKSFYPNNFGLHNACGNVAEMVQEKGIAKGGSWESPGGDVQVKSRAHYAIPSRDIGFRVFMVVVEKWK